MNKYFWKEKKGGLSLFAAIAVTGILVLALILHQVFSLRIYQAQVSQALTLQLEATAAKYDRKLKKRYGLWGIDPSQVDHRVMDGQLALLKAQPLAQHENPKMDFTLSGELLSPDVLRQGIQAYMKPRLPLQLVQSMKDKFEGKSATLESVFKEGSSILKDKANTIQENKEDLVNFGSKKDVDAEKDVSEADKQDIFEFQGYLKELFAVGIGDNVGGEDSILSTVSDFDNTFSFPNSVVLDEFLMNEYALGDFSYATQVYGKDVGKTLSRQSIASLSTASPHEVEYVVTGISDPVKALSRIKLYIQAVRMPVQVYAVYHDSFAMARFNVYATAIKTAIFLLTLGQVNIPIKAISSVFVLWKAYQNTKEDVKNLLDKKTVPFVPKKVENIKLKYVDFLRLFLFIPSQDNKLSRLGSCVQKNMGNQYFTELDFSLGFKHIAGLKSNTITRKYTYYIEESDYESTT